MIALTPPVEWAIHVYFLHARPIRIAGRRHDLLAAREHRAHHEAPAELDGVLIPTYAVGLFVAQIALTVWLVSFPIHFVLGGNRLAHAATGLVVSYLILGAYEWCHFLIHTPYRPQGAVLPLDLARPPAAPLQERALLVRGHVNSWRSDARDSAGAVNRGQVRHGPDPGRRRELRGAATT